MDREQIDFQLSLLRIATPGEDPLPQVAKMEELLSSAPAALIVEECGSSR